MKLIKLLSLIAFAGLLVTASMISRNHHLLLSKTAPAGIVTLELTRSNSLQHLIFTEWNRPGNYVYERDWSNPEEEGGEVYGVKVAERQTYADFYFIFFYVCSLILLFKHYYRPGAPGSGTLRSWQFFLFSGAVVLAGLLDVIENVYILRSIDSFNSLKNANEAAYVFYPALFKFAILILTIIYFGWCISLLKRLVAMRSKLIQ